MIALCKTDSTRLLTQECERAGLAPEPVADGVVALRCEPGQFPQADGLCFAFAVVFNERRVGCGEDGKAPVGEVVDAFCSDARGRRFEGAWPLLAWGSGEGGMARLPKFEKALAQRIGAAMARVARLANHAEPQSGVAQGLVVVQLADGDMFVGTRCWFGGQCRMRDDPRAPSRSYLKVEEAFRVLGRAPREGETVVDVGAAPGGWSYSAARRGARVIAVDNGPLKKGAAEDPRITHVREDAFGYCPGAGGADWLLCDIVDEPRRVLELVHRWVESGWCRYFVVNVKTGRADASAVVLELMAPGGALRARCSRFYCRELYHDREEITVAGVLR